MWGTEVGERMKQKRMIHLYEDAIMKNFVSILHANVQIILKYCDMKHNTLTTQVYGIKSIYNNSSTCKQTISIKQ